MKNTAYVYVFFVLLFIFFLMYFTTQRHKVYFFYGQRLNKSLLKQNILTPGFYKKFIALSYIRFFVFTFSGYISMSSILILSNGIMVSYTYSTASSHSACILYIHTYTIYIYIYVYCVHTFIYICILYTYICIYINTHWHAVVVYCNLTA